MHICIKMASHEAPPCQTVVWEEALEGAYRQRASYAAPSIFQGENDPLPGNRDN